MAKKQKKDKGYKTSSLIIASFGYGAAQIFNFIYQQFAPLILDAKLSNLGNVVLSATIVSGLTGFIMSIDNILALGAGYEFTDYSSADMRYITSSGYSGDDSRSDAEMNEEIGACLKGIHTLKVGAELRPDPKLALRLGYNFVSPKYENNDVAYRNQKVNSPGVFYASTTDYTNWRATHRITAGVGTKIDKVSLDLAYQYSITQGDFFPFPDGEYYQNGDGSIRFENLAPATKIDFKRHQIMLTLGYSF